MLLSGSWVWRAFIVLGIALGAAGCAAPKVRELLGCRAIPLPGPVYDMADAGAETGVVLASVQDTTRVDAQGEWINHGSIYLINRKTYETARVAIQGRDDYPFKPRGIDVIREKADLFVYVVNAAFREQRSLETYRLVKGTLTFLRRSRLYRLKHIVDVSAHATDDLLLVSGNGGRFAGFPQLLQYQKRLYRSIPEEPGSTTRFGSSENGISLLPVPDRNEVIEIWGSGSTRAIAQTKLSPVAVDRRGSRLLILQRPGDSASRGILSVIEVSGSTESAASEDFQVPVIQPEALLLLRSEKRILVSGEERRGGRLVSCDEP